MSIEATIETKANPIIDPPADLALPELFSMLDVVEADIADEMTRIQHKRTIVAELRGAIEQRLRTDGTASVTDAATGYRARIEQRKDWKVTDLESARLFIRHTERWHLLTVDTKAAIEYQKDGANHRIPGIDQVTTERLVITPPKGGK
jgi:hypothetical protein